MIALQKQKELAKKVFLPDDASIEEREDEIEGN